MKVCANNLGDTKKLAEIFAQEVKNQGAFVSLYGDIGTGKTAFARFVLKNIGVKEKVTSPSFVILNEYKGAHLSIYHFDLYRLENEGVKSISEELREYSKPGVLTFVEWADFGKDEIPYDRLNINITYGEDLFDDTRFFEFQGFGKNYTKLADDIIKKYTQIDKGN